MPDGRIRRIARSRSSSDPTSRGSCRLTVLGISPATIPPYLISVSLNHAALPGCRVRSLRNAVLLRIALSHFRFVRRLRNPFLSRAMAQRHHVRSVLNMLFLGARVGWVLLVVVAHGEGRRLGVGHATRVEEGAARRFWWARLSGAPGAKRRRPSRGLLDAGQDSRSSLSIIPHVLVGNPLAGTNACRGFASGGSAGSLATGRFGIIPVHPPLAGSGRAAIRLTLARAAVPSAWRE